MDVSSRSIDARLTAIEDGQRTLAARLDAWEAGARLTSEISSVTAQVSDVRPSAADFPDEIPASFDLVASLSLVGRTLVLLGGAYLLRALTDARVLPAPVGIGLGFAYAAVWVIAADRTGIAGRPLSAAFYGATATIIALPLLFESMTRFAMLGGTSGSVVLMAIALAILGAAVHARLHALAWIIVVGAAATSVALTAATGFVLPFAIADIALGVVTLWIGYTVDWTWLRWLPALVANVAVLELASTVSFQSTHPPPWPVVATQLLLFAVYFASISVRTLVRAREVNLFETLQGTAALAVGFGGAVYVAQTTGSGAGLTAAIGLTCAAAAYAVAFAFVARRQGLHRNFHFYTSIALILVLASTMSWQASAPMVWAALAVLMSWTAARTGHFTLSLHGAIYIVSAAIGSGLLAAATVALAGTPAATTWSPRLIGMFAAGCACWAAPPAVTASDTLKRLPRLAIAVLVAGSAAAAIVVAAAMLTRDPGIIATVRTIALASAALAVALAGRLPRFAEAEWLVYPLLIAGGVKLVVEDLPHSRPSTLFIALAVYGVALINAPRIARGATDPP